MVQRMLMVVLGLLLVAAQGCAQVAPRGGLPNGVVVLDIGHSFSDEGARTPGTVAGKRLTECSFWYQYAIEVKRVVEAAGHRCVVTNRGYAPTREPFITYARKAGVVHLRHPDNGQRYPSHYFADRVSVGMVSADYAVWRKASCAVFLHHNSSGARRWRHGASPSIILCNKFNGRQLAESLCQALNTQVLNHGLPNGGRECQVEVRSVDASRAAGWLNTCDDAGIPAAVVEAAFLDNYGHASYLAQDARAREYAQAIGQGIVNYLRHHGADERHYREDLNKPDEGSFGYARESRKLRVPGARRLLH